MAKNIFRHSFSCLTIVFLMAALPACEKDRPDCFSRKLYREYRDAACITSCPGVIGCDGEFYCNACDAARNGIAVE